MDNRLTNSRMACAKTCLKKHFFAYELGLRRDIVSAPLRMGTAVHLGLDMLAQGLDPYEPIRTNYAEVPAWCTDVDEWMTECEICCRLVSGYAWLYADSGVDEIVATEQAFNLPLRNPETGSPTPNWRMAGKIDKIAKLKDGRIAIIEHKTTGEDLSADSDYWKRLMLDQQISLYVIAARELGYDVQTILYDVIRKPSIRPKNVVQKDAKSWPLYYGEEMRGDFCPDRERPRMYGARLTTDISERPEFYYARREIPRLEADLDEFRVELWQQQQSLSACRNCNRWFRNTNACLHPYKCDFFNLCCSGWTQDRGTPDGFVILDNVNPELE